MIHNFDVVIHSRRCNIGSLKVTINSFPNQYVGLIDEVAIYDKALTAEQIQNHYTAGQL
jgi:hypothetical protein